jgi:hypothetical protein
MKKMINLILVLTVAFLGGCAFKMDRVAALPKSSDGVVLAVVGNLSVVSAEFICNKFKDLQDTRCNDQFVGAYVATHTDFWNVDAIPLLAPKSAGIEGKDIVKVRIHATKPADFIELVSKGMSDPSCYYDGVYGRGSGGKGGVVCPKENWDYKKDVNR